MSTSVFSIPILLAISVATAETEPAKQAPGGSLLQTCTAKHVLHLLTATQVVSQQPYLEMSWDERCAQLVMEKWPVSICLRGNVSCEEMLSCHKTLRAHSECFSYSLVFRIHIFFASV